MTQSENHWERAKFRHGQRCQIFDIVDNAAIYKDLDVIVFSDFTPSRVQSKARVNRNQISSFGHSDLDDFGSKDTLLPKSCAIGLAISGSY